MAVNWNWSDKKGELYWKPKAGSDVEEKTFVWNIYSANCLGCMLYEWKEEDGTDMYKFMCFFDDTHHLKRMLGLETFKGYGGVSIKEDWFKEIYPKYEIDYIKLDMSYKSNEALAKYFVKAGYEVRMYKGE